MVHRLTQYPLTSLLLFLWGVTAAPPLSAQSPSVNFLAQYTSSTSDPGLAQLSLAIASDVDVSLWPTIPVFPNDGLDSILQRYYGLFPDPDDSPQASPPRSLTTLTVADLIARTNNVPVDLRGVNELTVPPLPMPLVVDDSTVTPSSFRIFYPETRTYLLVDGEGTLALAENVLQPAETTPWRAATTLAILSDFAAFNLPPAAASALRPLGERVNIELLQTLPCPHTVEHLLQSPYINAARAHVAAHLSDIRRAAATGPSLRLLDFDFPNGHGNDVRSTALRVLEYFGAPDELHSNVLSVELNPFALGQRVHRLPMLTLLDTYYDFGATLGVQYEDIQDAIGWVMEPDMHPGPAIRILPPILIQAHLWEALHSNDWLNASWRLQSSRSALPVELDRLVRRGSFGSFAAGNDHNEPILASLPPQSVAILHREFANVTYGTRMGDVWGSITRPGNRGGVHLSTASCEPSLTDMPGSSLASAVVATSAWLRHLIDGTSSSAMRDELIRSSLLVEPPALVDSGGFFDPARLIAPDGAHYLEASSDTVTPIANPTLASNCDTYSGRRDVIVYSKDGHHYMVVRHDDPIRIEEPCRVSSLRFAYEGPDGTVIAIDGAAAFVARVKHLTMF